MAHIAVDMTPALPGGKCGGAKVLAIELLKGFQRFAGGDQLLVLTASWNHEELAFLDGPGMKRLCVLKKSEPDSKRATIFFSGRIFRKLRRLYWSTKGRIKDSNLFHERPLTSRGVDVLFCPFTSVDRAEPGISVVSVIHDLQHRDLPHFFSLNEIDLRNNFMSKVQKRADLIICVSDYVRQSVLKHIKTDPQRTFVIPNCIQSRLIRIENKNHKQILAGYGLDDRSYMFYPANFWPHKNHRMLLTAYAMFLLRNPDKAKIDLVFTGALDELEKKLRGDVEQMGLLNRVHFLGYLPEEELSAVWRGCEFLIFPSLYEGFGIPLLEAMLFEKPILCSNTTSLPEVAGNAAVFFDPRKPEDIARYMEKVIGNDIFIKDLTKRGKERAKEFKTENMVKRYLDILRLSLARPKQKPNEISGIFDDDWTEKKIEITTSSGDDGRMLELKIAVPHHAPVRNVRLKTKGIKTGKTKWSFARGQEAMIRIPLPKTKSHFAILISPSFRPIDHGIEKDTRELGVIFKGCWISSGNTQKRELIREAKI
jgi:glycosyltransferase involved in cell wall biosynthesis